MTESGTARLPEGPTAEPWLVQHYKPNPFGGGSWVPASPPSEWRALSAYTAVGHALVGDPDRKPLQIGLFDIIAVGRASQPGPEAWLTAAEVSIIARAMEEVTPW